MFVFEGNYSRRLKYFILIVSYIGVEDRLLCINSGYQSFPENWRPYNSRYVGQVTVDLFIFMNKVM